MLGAALSRCRDERALALALLLAAVSPSALAQDEPADARWLEWYAPPGCPDDASARAAIAALRDDRGPRRDAHALVAIHSVEDGRWRARVEVSDQGGTSSREVDGANCARVADAAALVVALAFDAIRQTEPRPRPHVSEAARPTPSLAAERQRVESQGQSLGLRLAAAASFVSDLGSLPGPSPGVSIAVILALDRLALSAEGAAWLPRLAAGPGDGGVNVSLLSGALRACYALLAAAPQLEIGPCLAVELGRAHGEPHRLLDPTPQRSLWAAALAGVRLRYHTAAGPGAWLGLELGLPLVRPHYVVAGHGSAFQAAPVAGRALIGLRWDF